MEDHSFFLEIIKLTIPFVFSLVLILVSYRYNKYIEYKSKKSHLIKGITNDFKDCINICTVLNTQLDYLKQGEVKYYNIDFPISLSDCAKRMAELDCSGSAKYSTYLAFTEIVRNDHKNLISLLNVAANSSPKINNILYGAIASQFKALKKDIVLKAESELEILKHLNKKDNSFDFKAYNTIIESARLLI